MRTLFLAPMVLLALHGCSSTPGGDPGADAGGAADTGGSSDTGMTTRMDTGTDTGRGDTGRGDTGRGDTGTAADGAMDGGSVDVVYDDTNLPGFDAAPLVTCDAGHASVTGHVYAPNHTDPIPNVRVVLLPDTVTFPPAATSVVCDHCTAVPPTAIGTALSLVDGMFTISSSALDAGGTYTFEMLSGGFRHVVRHVVVPRCGSVALTSAQTSFSGATMGEDTIPTIAVASVGGTPARGTNVNDDFATVLDAIGITGYERYNPDRMYPAMATGMPSPHIHDLLAGSSPTPLSHYQIVILPCGTLGNYTVGTNLTDPLAMNLRTWLQAGGRLYASDLSYPFIDHVFPGGITFAPGPSPHMGAPPADVGVGQGTTMGAMASPLNATVDDSNLRAWLNTVGATTGSTIPVTQFKDPWGAMDAIPPSELMADRLGGIPGHVWVSGDVLWHGTTGATHHPLTAQVDYPGTDNNYCGRVAFTSYHVRTAPVAGMPASALSPQERVLEYLFFQLTTCIQCSLTAGCTH